MLDIETKIYHSKMPLQSMLSNKMAVYKTSQTLNSMTSGLLGKRPYTTAALYMVSFTTLLKSSPRCIFKKLI